MKPSETAHDHHAIGVCAHDVAVVVGFDPLRRGGQGRTASATPFQQLDRAGALGKLPFQCLPRVGFRVQHHPARFSPRCGTARLTRRLPAFRHKRILVSESTSGSS